MITLIAVVVLTPVVIIGGIYLMAGVCYLLAAIVGALAWLRDRLFPRRAPDRLELWKPILTDWPAGIPRITDPNAIFTVNSDPPSAEKIRQN